MANQTSQTLSLKPRTLPMLFNSLQFLVFFLVITLLFFRIQQQQGRVWLLILGSVYFYMSFIQVYILILAGVIVVDYFVGFQIAKASGLQRKLWLLTSLVANAGTLIYFKYYNFFIENLQAGLSLVNHPAHFDLLKIALPVGLSFHTFQAMSYTLEVYKGNQQPERKFSIYALYVMFYPQLVAGPIERPQNLLHQFHEYRPYNWDSVKEGLSRMAWGFFKKCVIADRLAMLVDYTYGHYDSTSYLVLWIGAVFYAFQMYCDFSGYTDIALGAARVMNFELMENFDQPFLAKNLSNYWSRWHRSLSTWFSDYIFNPMTVSLRQSPRAAVMAGLLLTFFISGLWHGADWKYIVWGLLHGVVLVYEFLTRKFRKKLFKRLPEKLGSVIGIFFTFTYGVLAFIFFRAHDIKTALSYIRKLFTLANGSTDSGMHVNEIAFSVALIAIMMIRENRLPGFQIKNNTLFYFYICSMVVLCYFFGVFGENQFIYFQF